jgi:hypothetical protein
MNPFDINTMRRLEGDWGRPKWDEPTELIDHPVIEFIGRLIAYALCIACLVGAYTLPATPDAHSPASASSTASEGVGAVNRAQ